MGCGIACFGQRGPKNHLNFEIMVSKFVPKDLKGRSNGTWKPLRRPSRPMRCSHCSALCRSLRSLGTSFETKV